MTERTERIDLDAYFTPEALAVALVERVAALMPTAPAVIWEPHCGGGAFVRAAHACWGGAAEIVAFDITPTRRAAVEPLARFEWMDWLGQLPGVSLKRADLIIGNPPYTGAADHVERAVERVAPGGFVAFLLRAAFLSSAERLRGVSASGPTGRGLHSVHFIAPRPSFTGTGSDNSEYALCVWQRGNLAPATVGAPLFWVQPKRAKVAKP